MIVLFSVTCLYFKSGEEIFPPDEFLFIINESRILFPVASLTKDETTPVNDQYVIRDSSLTGIANTIREKLPSKDEIVSEKT